MAPFHIPFVGAKKKHIRDFDWRRWVRLYGVPLFFFNIILLPYIDFVQVWDGHWFFECLLRATSWTEPFSIQNFFCLAHPTGAYLGLFAIPQYFDYGNVVLLNGLSFLLGNLAVLAFCKIVLFLFPKAKDIEVMLMTLLFAVHPAVLGNTLHFNFDIGVLFFSLYVIYGLFYGRTVVAMAAGIMMVFTKEIGILMYAVIAGWYVLFCILRPQGSGKEKLRSLGRRFLLGLPPLAFGLFALLQSTIGHRSPVWEHFPDRNRLHEIFLQFNLLSPDFLLALKDIFVINFLWIGTVVLVVASGKIAFEWSMGALDGRPLRKNMRGREFLVILFTFLLGIYLLTRVIPFNNIRYFAVLYPLQALVLFGALRYLKIREHMRILFLSMLFILSVLSVYRTVDPVSRLAFGTFKAGKRTMLAMAYVRAECCGYGRDQLVYNLQWPVFARLQDKAFAMLRENKDLAVSMHPGAWRGFWLHPVDPLTYRRVPVGGVIPRSIDPFRLPPQQDLPERLAYIRHPFVLEWEHADALERLRHFYDLEYRFTVSDGGYELPVNMMRLRK